MADLLASPGWQWVRREVFDEVKGRYQMLLEEGIELPAILRAQGGVQYFKETVEFAERIARSVRDAMMEEEHD